MDAFRAVVNGLCREFQTASVGHTYATVIAASLTLAITLLSEGAGDRPMPDDVVTLLALMDQTRARLGAASTEADKTSPRPS